MTKVTTYKKLLKYLNCQTVIHTHDHESMWAFMFASPLVTFRWTFFKYMEDPLLWEVGGVCVQVRIILKDINKAFLDILVTSQDIIIGS